MNCAVYPGNGSCLKKRNIALIERFPAIGLNNHYVFHKTVVQAPISLRGNECARRVQSGPVPVLSRVMTPIIGIISPRLFSSFRRFCRGPISPSFFLVTEPILW